MVVTNILGWFFILLPFQFSLGSFGSSDIAVIRLFIPLLFLFWLLTALGQKKISLPRPLTLFLFSAFLAWALVSLAWSQEPQWAFKKALFWLNFFPLFLVLVATVKEEPVRRKVVQGLVLGAFLVSLVGIGQFLAQFFFPLPALVSFLGSTTTFFLGTNFASVVASYPSILVNIGGITFLRAFAFFPDPHIFAYYTSMVLPLALYVALQEKQNRWYLALPIIILVATLLSFSRASYLALSVGGLMLGVRYCWQRKKSMPIFAVLVIVTALLVLTVSPVATRLLSSFSQEDGSVVERSRLWQEAIVNIRKEPILGVGLGNYPLTVKPNAAPREPIYIHNLYLDIVAELGIVGLFLFLAFIASVIPSIFNPTKRIVSYRFTLLLSLVIFLTHSLFEYPLFSIHILTLLLTLLALLYVEKIRTA